jgi:O-antigen/teichoic acid export membrane protein
MLPIVGLTPLLNGLILDWPLLALGHSGAVARWRMLGQVAYGILVPFLVTAGIGGALRYAGLNALGLAVTAAGTIWAYRRVGQFSARDVTVGTVLRRARESMPFAVVLALLQVLGNMGPILLGYLVSTRSVGIFAVAYKVPTVIVSLTQMWLNAFFPYATKRTRSDAAGFARELERVLSLALVLMVMTALAGVVCANRLMPLLFGRAFASASLPFALLACSAGVVVVQACVTEGTLMAIDSQRWYVGMLVVAVPLMIALEVGLIGAFGLDGAAGAAIAINAYLAVAGYLGVRRKLGRLRANAAILVRGWLCAGTMALAMLITQEAIGLTPGIAAGALAFVVVAWLTGLPRAVLAD